MKFKLYYYHLSEIKSIEIKGKTVKNINRKIELFLRFKDALYIGSEYVG